MKRNFEKKGSMLSSKKQQQIQNLRANYFKNGKGNTLDKINSFTRFCGRQNIAKLIAQYHFFHQTSGTLGDIVEAGVYFGSGLMGWANLAVALEPYNYQCKIIGFDTFKGSKGVSLKDKSLKKIYRRDGEYNANNYLDLSKAIELFDMDRPLKHIKKIELVKGEISKTVKKYCKENKQQCIRILHLGMNLYAPTYATLKSLLPRMSKGSMVIIDGINYATPGCKMALEKVLDIKKIKLKNLDFYPNFTYFEI